MIKSEIRELLNVDMVLAFDIKELYRTVDDLVVYEHFNLRGILYDICKGSCPPLHVSHFANLLSAVMQDAENIKRDEPFPKSLVSVSKVLLSLYVFDTRLASQETIETFMPTAKKLLSENKIKWLKSLPMKQALKEIESFLHMVLIKNCTIRAEQAFVPIAETFFSLGISEVDARQIVNDFEKSLGLCEGVIMTSPHPRDTFSDYAEVIYFNL